MPTARLLTRDPISRKPLDEAGEWKEATDFWLRRVRDADVIDATKEKLAADAAPVKAPVKSPEKTAPEKSGK